MNPLLFASPTQPKERTTQDDEPPGKTFLTHASAVTHGSVRERMETLRERIAERRPELGEIMRKHGQKNLYEYARDFLDVNPSPLLDSRKPEMVAVIERLLADRLGPIVAGKVARQLQALPLVSTADHHSPIDHPFWTNANIISALPSYENEHSALRYLVVLSFSTVSANNASGYPRGLLFHGGVNGSGNLIRLPILPDKIKMGVVYKMRSFTSDDLQRAQQELRMRGAAGEILPEKVEGVSRIIDEFFADPDVLSASDLSAQITKINYRLWPRLFHAQGQDMSGKTITNMPSDLIYLEIETIVRELLLTHHLDDPQSLINRLLFDPQWRPFVLKRFDNLAGAFSLASGKGTYLFWAVDERMRRIGLKLVGDMLMAADSDSSFSFPLTPDGLREALESRRIFPSMLLCYLLVSLYYGMKCLGGFCQVHDLTVIKQAWRDMLLSLGRTDEADAILPVQTKELGGDGMVLSYLRTAKGEFVPATGIDMILEGEATDYGRYVELSRRVTLLETMSCMLPEMYTVLYGASEREPALASLTSEQILHATGLDQKFLL